MKRLPAGRWTVTVTAMLALFVSVVQVGPVFQAALEDRFPVMTEFPEAPDGIIVLGGVVSPGLSAARGRPEIGGAVERLLAFVELGNRYPDARLVFTGGSGSLSNQDVSEADFVKPVLSKFGLDTERVEFEGRSRNTVENALFSKELVDPQPGEKWVLITSAFHMPRSVGCFRKAGWDVIPYPVDFYTTGTIADLFGFSLANGQGGLGAIIHEGLGLFFYWLTGKTDALFPGPAA